MRLILVLLLIIPNFAFGASSGSSRGATTPPKATKTTKTCKGIKVYDTTKKRCVKPQNSSLDTQKLYESVRELAYAGRYFDAQGVLRAMPDQQDDRVLTYWGFTHRKLGNTTLAVTFYKRALTANPDNILARSYMGQGFIEDGNIDAAIAQWREIKARGGVGTWAEASLRTAIQTGITYNY